MRFSDLALWTAPALTPEQTVAAVAPVLSPRMVSLAGGTSLSIRTLVPVDSQTSADGDVVPFIAADDTIVDGMVVIARGAIGYGHLENIGRAANWGRSGSLRLVADAITAVDGTVVKVRGDVRVAPPRVKPRFFFAGLFVRGRTATLSPRALLSVVSTDDVRIAVTPSSGSAALTQP